MGTFDTAAAARETRSIGTDLAMLQAAIDAGQPAPALTGGILDAAQRLLVIFGQEPLGGDSDQARTLPEAVRDLHREFTEADDDGASSNDIVQLLDDWFTTNGFAAVLYR